MEVTKELIETNWPLTEVVISIIKKQGDGGHVGIISAKEGKYTYKIPGPWKTATNLYRDLGGFEFLGEKHFPYITTLLRTQDNKRFIQKEDKLLYLMAFIEGDHPKMIPTTYTEFGKIVATLHNVKDFPFETDYKPTSVIPDLIQKAIDYPFGAEYIEILKSIRLFEGLSKTLTHSEITHGNTIQTPEGKIIVIDWDELGIGPAVLDLGVSLINHHVTEDLEINEDNARAYYQSYFSLHEMGEEEKDHIWDAALYWACAWIMYGDMDKRWGRIKWAIENKQRITSLYN